MAAHQKALVEAARSLADSVGKTVQDTLGDAPGKSDSELSLDGAWKALGRGELATAIELCSTMLATERHNEKLYFTRAYSFARAGEWRKAMADYSSYMKIYVKDMKMTSGTTLANAYYGRALCLAKLGRKSDALRDLNECIRVGPAEEQATEANASLVPRAKAAKMVLCEAYRGLAGKEEAAAAGRAAALAKAKAAEGEGTDAGDEPVYEGKVWRVPVTCLESAMARCVAAGKTPLLLDSTEERVTDSYFMYAEVSAAPRGHPPREPSKRHVTAT